jgi:hypothetical protein
MLSVVLLRKRGIGPWLTQRGGATSPFSSWKHPVRRERLVLPYLGGGVVASGERHLLVVGRPKPGWLVFEVEGRLATPVDQAAPEGLDRLPQARGHLEGGLLFEATRRATRVHLLPDDQPPPLSPCATRRLTTGQMLFESLDFDTESEEFARLALDEDRPLGHDLALPPSLRLAFGWAMLLRAAASQGFRPTIAESWPLLDLIAAEGMPVALALASSLRPVRPSNVAQPPSPHPERSEAAQRAEASLAAAGARLLRSRTLAGGLLELTFRLLERRFTAVVEATSLRLIDPGFCLAGAHPLLTLDCLPAVVREAAEAGRLHVTRR